MLGASTCEEGDRHVPALVGDGDDPADHISGHHEEHHHSDGGSGEHLPGQSSGDLGCHGEGLVTISGGVSDRHVMSEAARSLALPSPPAIQRNTGFVGSRI